MNTNTQKSIAKIMSKANDLHIAIGTLNPKNPAKIAVNDRIKATCKTIIKNAENIDLTSEKAAAQLNTIAAQANNINSLLSNIQLTQINYVYHTVNKSKQLALDIMSTAKNIIPYLNK